jgi:para-nitrobenzyl esterase
MMSPGGLRALPAGTILEPAKKPGSKFPVNVDGRVITEPVADTYAKGKQAQIPLLAGWNIDEGSFIALHGMTVEQRKEMARNYFKERTDQLLKIYPGGTDAQAQRSAIDYVGDSFISLDPWIWLEEHRKTGDAPVYRYRFELPSVRTTSGMSSAQWIPGLNGTCGLSDQMMTYWTNFARTGDPNGEGVPEWPKYNDADFPLVHLNDPITSGPDHERAHCEYLLNGMPRFQF